MSDRLIILGNGTTAERLAELGRWLGYDEVQVRSDGASDVAASDHVVIAEDSAGPGRALLRQLVAGVAPAYLGYAAPRSEGSGAWIALVRGAVPVERLDEIAAPAGVDVGAESPEEVAIAIAAELVAVRHGRPRPSAGLPLPGGADA